MRNLVVLSLAILICQATLAKATDFSLFAETTAAYVLPGYEQISLDDAVHSSESILWQIDFSILVENVSPAEVGFGTLSFDIELQYANDQYGAGWNPNTTCVDATFMTCLLNPSVSGDRGASLWDLKEIYVEVGGTFFPFPIGIRRYPLTGGPWLIGSLYLTDTFATASSVAVSSVFFSGMLANQSFSDALQPAKGQNIMYLPRTLGGSRLIYVSTAIPEPHTLTLFLTAAAAGFGRRSRIRMPARRM